jgi:hypothetical protein
MNTRSGYGDASGGSSATPSAAGVSAPSRLPGEDAAARAGSEPAEPGGKDSTAAGPAAAQRLLEELEGVRAALGLLIAARYDQFGLAVRRAYLFAVLAAAAILGVAGLVVTACVMLVVGIAGGLSEWSGGRLWVGQLLTGSGLIVFGGLAGFGLVRVWQYRSRRKTLKRYGKVE